jgi:hydrogenase maturation protease
MKTIIVGLGNPILGDDGVGIHIVREIRQRKNGGQVAEVIELSTGGLRLLEAIADYDKAIIADAVIFGGTPGTIYRFNINDSAMSLKSSSTHDMSLASAIEIGERLGIKLPAEIIIYGVEIADVNNFREDLTQAVKSAIPIVTDEILKEYNRTKNRGFAST